MTSNAKPKPTKADQALTQAWATQFGAPLVRFFERQRKTGLDAEDLAQEVLLRLAREPGLQEIDHPERFIFKIAWNVLHDARRKHKVRAGEAHETFDNRHHGVMGLTPEHVIIDKQALQKVVDALFELPERTRTVYVLYHFENYRQADIAKKLGIGLSTVEHHMTKANRHILAKGRDAE